MIGYVFFRAGDQFKGDPHPVCWREEKFGDGVDAVKSYAWISDNPYFFKRQVANFTITIL